MKRLATALAVASACAGSFGSEKDYQLTWCINGATEYRLEDRTRVDCLTDRHAIEFDFAPKWAEALGQSLHYSRMTGKRAGIVLIYRKPADRRYLERLNAVIEQHQLPIDVWVMQ